MKEEKREIKEGVCPICGHKDLDYGSMDIADGDYVYYDWRCRNCKTSGKEYFSLTFIGHNVWDSEHKKEVIYNA